VFRAKKGPKSAQARFVFIVLTPIMIFFGVITLVPFFSDIVLAFFRYNLLKTRPTAFVGIGNFINILSDSMFWLSLKNTFFYIILIVPNLIIWSLLAALAITASRKGKAFYRASFFVPCITSMVTVVLVWKFILLPTGLINELLKAIGLSTKAWLGDTRTFPWAVSVMMIWQQLGYGTILFLAGMDGIPGMYYEAAKMDGANNWHCFWHITFPLLKPVLLFVLVIMTIWSFKIFDPIQILRAQPANSVIVFYIYQNAFRYLKLGYGSAVALVLFAIILAFTLIQFKILRKKWEY